MIKKILGALLMLAFTLGLCVAQRTNRVELDPNWRSERTLSSYNATLSISLTNSIIKIGSTMTLTGRIANNSTNVIYVVVMNPETDFAVYMTDYWGKTKKITRDGPKYIFDHRGAVGVPAGQTYECLIPVKIDKSIWSGNYSIKANRHILTSDSKDCELESNILKVKLVD